MKSLQEAKAQLEGKLSEYEQELLSDDYLEWKNRGRGVEEGEEAEVEGFNFDEATPKEIVSYLEKKYKGDLEKVVGELSGKIGEMEEKIGLALAQIDIELTSQKYPDFWDYRDRIIKIAEENPTWNAERCYKQAKMEVLLEQEQKRKEMAKKAEQERKLLSEKGGVPPIVTAEKEISEEEAAKIAYKMVFGNKGEEF